MNTQTSTLSDSDLLAVNGGDAAGDYGKTLRKDWKDINDRAQKTADALKQGQWGSAAKNFGGVLINEIKGASDALQPVKDLIGLGKS